jgi:sulfite exporter TauE/SafE
MIALAGSVLLASLLGSAHCAGMCGGFVCFYSGQPGGAPDARGAWARALPHLAYSAGRLVTYLALGLLAGALGSTVERLGHQVGVARAAALLAGALMIGWGVLGVVEALGHRPSRAVRASFLRRPIGAALRAVQAQAPAVRALTVGLVTTLLPCGWLYAFVAIAGGTGSPARGAVVMAAFWLGTLPVMAGLGFAAQDLLGRLRRRLPLVTASMLIVLGALTVLGRLNPGAHDAAGHGHPAAPTSGPHSHPR